MSSRPSLVNKELLTPKPKINLDYDKQYNVFNKVDLSEYWKNYKFNIGHLINIIFLSILVTAVIWLYNIYIERKNQLICEDSNFQIQAYNNFVL